MEFTEWGKTREYRQTVHVYLTLRTFVFGMCSAKVQLYVDTLLKLVVFAENQKKSGTLEYS